MTGRLIASGRSADIHEADDGRVARRRRSGPIPDHEVIAMRHVRQHGYPVPNVHSVSGAEMVMDRVDGRSLLTELAARPWRAPRVGRTMADLHRRLADVPIDGVEMRVSSEPVEAIVHGDLHPGNVIVTEDGPVVIDWEGASLGPRDADAATLWLLLTVAEIDGMARPMRLVVPVVRRIVLAAFLAAAGRPRPATVSAVCDDRANDPNMRPSELDRIRRFRERHATRS